MLYLDETLGRITLSANLLSRTSFRMLHPQLLLQQSLLITTALHGCGNALQASTEKEK